MSASRAASLGSPSTTLTTRPVLRVPAAPTSTYPARSVCPVFTPVTNGLLAIRRLRFSTTRGRAPEASRATGVSTMRAKRLLRMSRAARAARSRAVE